MAEPNTSQTITLPSDVLQSLLASVNDLQNEVFLLRQENKTTRGLLKTIQAKIDVEFDSSTEWGSFEVFPKLPIEIRHLIWDAALKSPRIVGARIVVQDRGKIEETLVPTAPNSPILFVNKEARSRAKEILVCFTSTVAKTLGRVPLLYLNPDVDTLWLVNYTPERAKEGTITEDVVFGEELQIRKVAIPFQTWKSFTWGNNGDEEEGVARLLTRFHDKGIEKIDLIVGEADAAERTDIVLLSPREIVEFYMDGDWVQDLKAIYMYTILWYSWRTEP